MQILQAIGAFFLDIIETVVIALSIFLVVYLFLLQPHQVNGQSMVPTFQSGEYVLTDKVSYKIGSPKRGDVIVFHAPETANCLKGTGCDFIKRIIALPGETVEVKENAIWINGEKLQEDYIPKSFDILPGEYTRNRVVRLGEDEYFALGDNRPYSSDSRAWGPITPDLIVGRAFFRYWPLTEAGLVRHSSYNL